MQIRDTFKSEFPRSVYFIVKFLLTVLFAKTNMQKYFSKPDLQQFQKAVIREFKNRLIRKAHACLFHGVFLLIGH